MFEKIWGEEPRRMDNRGQLLLLSALAILLVVIVGATIINTASFSEYDRVSGVDSQTTDAIKELENTEYTIESLIRHENHDTSGSVNAENELTSGSLTSSLNENLNSRGKHMSLENVDVQNGVRIWRSEYGNLTKNGETEYELVTTDAEVRSFAIEVTGEELSSEESGNEFTVRLNESNDVLIGESSDGNVVINGGCEIEATESQPVTISFTHGKVNGVQCEELPNANHVGDIEVENADNIEAAFNLVADTTSVGAEFDTSSSPNELNEEIESHEAVFSITTTISIETPESTVSTETMIAPQSNQARTEGQ